MKSNALRARLAGACAAFCFFVPAAFASDGISDACFAELSKTPITIVVPNEAGGGYDTYARALALGFEELLGDPVRVSNMPAAGGRLAYTEVVQQGSDETVLLVDSLSDVVAATDTDPLLNFGSDAFAALGTIVSESSVWLGKPGTDLADPSLTELVVGANAVSSNLIDAGLVGRALGLNMRVVAGYDGSSETTAAVMRDETDIAILTITTALRRSKGTDLKVLLVLQDQQHASAPDAWVLGGESGLVEKRASDLPGPERDARHAMAKMAMSLAGTYRGVLTASHLEEEMVTCLRTATDVVLSGDTVSEAAGAQGRPVDPISSAQTVEIFQSIRESQAAVAEQLEALAAELAE